MTAPESDFETLIRNARNGDDTALGERLNHHRPWLRLLGRRGLGGKFAGRIDESDVAQQTFLSAVKGFEQFQGNTSDELAVWLQQIHERNLQDAVRKHAIAQKRSVDREETFIEEEIPSDGTYVLQLRYAAKEARPGRILLSGKVIREPAINQTNGDWYPPGQRWFFEGIHPLKSGLNTFRLESEPLMTHIDKLRLLKIEAGSMLATLVDRQKTLTREIAELETLIKPPLQVMAVQEGDIGDAHILVRGNAHKPAEKVARGFLQVASTTRQTMPADQSGRLQLAEWMTQPNHPLTSRVMVNRLWRWHFGRGIVATPDNFGTKGARPSHPKLLDYLARRFVEQGWSIKAMHREILNSRTWQMGAAPESVTLQTNAPNIDPENLLHWEYPRRRLEAEVIRDALLDVSGRLDRKTGGAPLELQTINLSPELLEKQQQHYDESNRRTIYLPVLRTNVDDFLTLFDFANPDLPTGNRVTTTVPTQE